MPLSGPMTKMNQEPSRNLNLKQKVNCFNCGDNIFANHTAAIKCLVCTETELCPECFAAGAEFFTHKKDHPFHLVHNYSFNIFKSDWTACEHFRLMKAADIFSMGNWSEIADKINNDATEETGPSTNWKKRTGEEAKEEYESVFVQGPLGKLTWTEDIRVRAHGKVIEYRNPNTEMLEPVFTELSNEESLKLGYLAKRREFEVEPDNGAEAIITYLDDALHSVSEMSREDKELHEAFKIAHIEIYNSKIAERQRTKKIAKEHSLASQFFNEFPVEKTIAKSRKPKDSVIEGLKAWASIVKPSELRQILTTLTKERQLVQRIKTLQRYRKNGISQLVDAHEFESLKQSRSQVKKTEKKMQFAIKHEIVDNTDGTILSSPDDSMCGDEIASTAIIHSPFSPQILLHNSQKHFQPGLIQLPQFQPSSVPDKLIAGSNTIERFPGFDLLSNTERKLCSNLRLSPSQYISYKTCLLSVSLQRRKGQTATESFNPIGLDKNDKKILFNFFMRAGWISGHF